MKKKRKKKRGKRKKKKKFFSVKLELEQKVISGKEVNLNLK